jgi:hypothetical protein
VRVSPVCPTCGKPFEPRKKRRPQRYCSKSCLYNRGTSAKPDAELDRLSERKANLTSQRIGKSALKRAEASEQLLIAETHARLKAEFLEREAARRAA